MGRVGGFIGRLWRRREGFGRGNVVVDDDHVGVGVGAISVSSIASCIYPSAKLALVPGVVELWRY